MKRAGFLAVSLLLLMVVSVFAQPVEHIPPGRFWVTVDGDSTTVPYVSSHDLDGVHPELTRAVIFIPPGPRDVINMAQRVVGAGNQAGVSDTTFYAGLQFLLLNDLQAHGLEGSDIAYWNFQDWGDGNLSRTTPAAPRDVFVSSYTFLDSLVVLTDQICPNLNCIVICGNSEAGQYIARYQAVTRIPTEYPDLPPILFTPMNSGNFLYVSRERMSSSGEIGVPCNLITTTIDYYNEYPYGLENLNEYAAESGIDYIREQYPNRWINHLAGSLDNGANSDNLPMALQGFNNNMRCKIIIQVHEAFYGYPLPRTQFFEIPGAGHSNIWNFSEIWYPLFHFTPPPDNRTDG